MESGRLHFGCYQWVPCTTAVSKPIGLAYPLREDGLHLEVRSRSQQWWDVAVQAHDLIQQIRPNLKHLLMKIEDLALLA